jgi:hypothetical protein
MSAYFGAGKLPIHLDDVKCTGTEISLPQCPHGSWGSNNCGHGEDVGISFTQSNYLKKTLTENKYFFRFPDFH